MSKIYFVCTGNTCRSPLAESYARKHFPDKDISSRGLFVTEDETNARSLAIIRDNNLPLPSLPTQLTSEDVTGSTLLVMSRGHKDAILERWPNADVKLISDFATGEESDILDPYGGTQAQYEAVYLQLKTYIDKFEW